MIHINYKKLGDRIYYYRTASALTQEKLAEMCDLTIQHVNNIENGRKGLSLDSLMRISHALNVTPDQLLADSLSRDTTDLNRLLLDCYPEAINILLEIIKAIKKVLSQYQIRKIK